MFYFFFKGIIGKNFLFKLMNLLKSLLAATAFLGILIPEGVVASEVDFKAIKNYSQGEAEKKEIIINTFSNKISLIEESIENKESEIIDFEVGSFSETTTLNGAAHFQIGAVEQGAVTEAVTATYSYDVDMNTTFTGEDNLYVGIETGSDSISVDFGTDNSGGGDDILNITSMYYQFPLGDYEVAIGPKLDNDDLLPTTTSKYSDSFFFGSQYALPVNYYALNTTGAGIAVARTLDNGWNFSGSLIGTGAISNAGFLTNEGADVLTLSLGYDSDENYGGGVIWTDQDSACGVINSFSANICTQITSLIGVNESLNVTSIGGYWIPNGGKNTISATTNLIDIEAPGIEIDFLADFQIALDREMGNGVFSASWKTFPFVRVPDLNVASIKGDDLGSFVEFYYTYNVNDSFQIKPGVSFALPTNHASNTTTDDLAFYLLDRTAVGLEASFKF